MKVDITMIDGSCHTEIDFSGCKTMYEIRTWLNKSGSFITLGETKIINSGQIIRIVEHNKEEDSGEEITVGGEINQYIA